MSKSLGNVVAPQKVMNTPRRGRAAPVGRGDRLRQRDERVGRDPEAHGGFLSAHAQHAALPARQPARLRSRAAMRCRSTSWWRSIAGRSRARARCRRRSSTAYRNYDFHLIYQKVHNFCIVDLGGFYLDVIKDRLYTTPARQRARAARRRRRCIHIAESMVRWLAPILSFTAEEIWRFLPGERARVGVPRDLASRCREAPRDAHRLAGADRSCAADVARELEKLRDAGAIGAPLDAEVDDLLRAATSTRASRRWATSCASCSSPRRRACTRSTCRAAGEAVPAANTGRGRRVDRGASRRPSRSACAAGTAARMSAANAEHPELCGALRHQRRGPGRAAAVRMSERDTAAAHIAAGAASGWRWLPLHGWW